VGLKALFEKLKPVTSSGLFKSSAIYTASNVINTAIPVLLLPVMTRYLTPAEYGIVATFLTGTMIMVSLVGLRLNFAVGRAYVDQSKKGLAEYVGTAFTIFLASLAVNFILLYFVRVPLGAFFNIDPGWVLLIVVVAFCKVCASVLLIIWRMEERAFPYGLFTIAGTAVQIALAILLVVVLGLHWQGRVLSIVISSAALAALAFYILLKKVDIRAGVNRAHAREMLHFGVPLIPAALSGWVLNMSDRLFLSAMVGLEATGLYTAGYALGNVIGILQNSFGLAWLPVVYKKLKSKEPGIKRSLVKFTYLHHVVIIALALTLSFSAPYILSVLVGKEFQGASEFVLLISLGYAFNGMFRMVVCYIGFARRTYLIAVASGTACVVNLVLNYVLIKRNGAIGAAQSTFISFVVLYLVAFYLSSRVYKMPWRLWRRGAEED
jgi:O-antigen/teichoic acid export membrane protein